VFVAAGAFRLARFNVEGLAGSTYRGLPVTYAGVLVPLAVLVSGWTEVVSQATAVALVLALMAPLMASSRFKTPRVSV
jgi:phosphatidylserine synthase